MSGNGTVETSAEIAVGGNSPHAGGKIIGKVVEKLSPGRVRTAVVLFGALMNFKCYPYRHARLRDRINYRSFLTAFMRPKDSAWVTLLAPSELLFPLGFDPLVLEAVGGIIGGLGLTKAFLKNTIEKGVPGSLCTFHRAHLGVILKHGFYSPGMMCAASALCDGNLRSMQEASDLLGSPFAFIDVPEPGAAGGEEYLAGQLADLYLRLARERAVADPLRRLKKTIALAEETRLQMEAVNNLRREVYLPKAPSLGLSWNLLNHTGMFGSPGALAFYRSLRKDLEKRGRPIPEHALRLLLTHLPPVYDHPVAESLRKKRGLVVMEEFNHPFWPPFNSDDPFGSIARKILAMPQLGDEEMRTTVINHLCEKYSIRGILNFAHWGCRQSSGSIQALRKKLTRPLLSVDVDLVDADSAAAGQISTRVESFFEVICNKK